MRAVTHRLWNWMPLTLAGFLLMTVAASPAQASEKINKSFFGGVAIEGYDPVAYFTDGKPVAGKKEFSFEWNEATWRFATAEHRDLFAKEPTRYAPQYGGWCAWAAAQNSLAGIDPNSWRIVDGKLYLNYSKSVQKQWEADIPGNIKKADGNWPKLGSGK